MKYLLITVLFFIPFFSVNASELLGQISTDPGNMNMGPGTVPGDGANVVPDPVVPASGPGTGIVSPFAYDNDPGPDSSAKPGNEAAGIKVLGEAFYPDGSLLRGPDGRIFLIAGQKKRHIASLSELRAYAGQTIINVAFEEIDGYSYERRQNGELIRRLQDDKVYEIQSNNLYHIKSLAELAADYFGLPIHNISRAEMADYL